MEGYEDGNELERGKRKGGEGKREQWVREGDGIEGKMDGDRDV